MAKEKLVAVCRPHWSSFWGRWFVAFLFAYSAIYGIVTDGADAIGSAICLLIIAGLCVGSALIMMKTTYLGMTETKIVGHTGFLRTRTLSTPLAKVQNIGLENGLFGKLLGYGTITISDAGSGVTEFVFKRMANAERFVEQV